ncbi:transcription factor HES-7.1-like [Mantella aurantiaca]
MTPGTHRMSSVFHVECYWLSFSLEDTGHLVAEKRYCEVIPGCCCRLVSGGRITSLFAPSQLLKPQVERRRRERINGSLEELRVFLSQAARIEKLQNPKIEKAEILEYTVQFLQSTLKPSEMPQDTFSQEYQSGFQHCLRTTLHLINSSLQLPYVSKDLLFQQLSVNHPEENKPIIRVDCLLITSGAHGDHGSKRTNKWSSWRPWI